MKKSKIFITMLMVLGLVFIFSAGVLGANAQKETAEETAVTEATSFIVDEENNTITYISPDQTNDEDVNVYEKFDDVSENAWYEGYLSHLVQLGVVNGVNEDEFAPNQYVTRAQFAKMLAYAADADLSQYQGVSSFADVSVNAWYAPAVEWANQQGLIKGRADGLYYPESYITREESAVLIDRYAVSEDSEIFEANQYALADNAGEYLSDTEMEGLGRLLADPVYGDQEQIADWAADEVAAMYTAGILCGDQENEFNPKDPLRRSECMKIISAYIINSTKPSFYFPGGSYIEYLEPTAEQRAAEEALEAADTQVTTAEPHFNDYGSAPDLSPVLPDQDVSGNTSLNWITRDHQSLTSSAFVMLNLDRSYVYNKMVNESFTYSYIDVYGNYVTNYLPGSAALCIYSYYTNMIENQNNKYYAHYYDADTGASYNTSVILTASQFFNNHFYNAYTSYRNGDKRTAYKEVGMSIHYLEDMNNPYHASNLPESLSPSHYLYETWSSMLMPYMTYTIDMNTYRFTYDNTFQYMSDSFASQAKSRLAVCSTFQSNPEAAKVETLYLLNRAARATAGILNRFYYYGYLNH